MKPAPQFVARLAVRLSTLLLCLPAWCLAQAPSTVVMVLPREEQNIEAAFRDYLKKRPVPARIEVLRFSGKAEDGPALVAQVRQLKPDLIYAWGTNTTLALAGPADAGAASGFIQDTPIVFTEVTDPVGSGLLRQLDPPQRNVTGVSHVAPLAVQLNTMRTYRPFKRLGYLTNPNEPNSALVLAALRKLGGATGFEVVEEVVPPDARGNPDPATLPALIQRIAAKQVDFLYIGPSTFLAFTHRDLVTQAALQARLPTFCATESIVRKASCLFGLFSSGNNVGRFAGYKAAQVLLEKQPVGKLPAETLQRFSLLINMQTARALALYPPLQLLNVAEVVD